MVTRRLLIRIMTEINTLIRERRLSSRELEDLCSKNGFDGITRSKIIRAFYIQDGRQYFLNSTDDTVEAVLTVLGFTGDDILERILSQEDEKVVRIKESLPPELSEFILNKESLPYLKLAHAKYKVDKVAKEFESIKSEISEKFGIEIKDITKND